MKVKAMVFAASMLFISLFSLQVNAQLSGVKGGFGYAKIGMGIIPSSSVRSLFAPGESSNLFLTFGGGGYAQLGKYLVGGSGWGSSATYELFGNGGEYYINHGGGGFEFGYELKQTNNRKIFGTILLGGMGTEIARADGRVGYSQGSIILGANVHAIQFFWPKPQSLTNYGGFNAGLRVGVYGGIGNGLKPTSGIFIPAPPNQTNYNPFGVNITLTIGGGGFGA